MKKNADPKLKLKLNRETLTTLEKPVLEEVAGGGLTPYCKSGWSCYSEC
jgi:hypothetical protein